MGEIRHVTLPGGFLAGAGRCGIKMKGEDLAILAAVEGAVPTAIATTSNQVVGSPVRWCRQVLPKGYGLVRGVVVNSGNSNVCNGKRGDRDAAAMAALAAKTLDCPAEQMLVCSTGVIGHPLPMDKIVAGVAQAGTNLGLSNDQAVLRAIMTTDTRPKSAVVQTRLGGKRVTVAGIVKGSGMIGPNVATMLSFITTDAAITPAALHKALREVCFTTFNAITVDGDRSTSDTIVLMASGAAGGRTIVGGAELARFTRALREVAAALAREVVRDGEGATKLLEITVSGARSDQEAAAAAMTIANSPLVKCAAHGGDPNWGRILCAAGYSPAKVDQDRATCKIGGVVVMRRGTSCAFDLKAVQEHMRGQTLQIELNLALGKGRFTALTCDFSREYITINADYHT